MPNALPREQQQELDRFPAVLRALIDAELAAGNTIVEIGHSHPAPPAGACVKFARKVTTRPRTSGDGLDFYERHSSSQSGEFTDDRRFFWVLEPPDPPPPEPDMDAIRRALEPSPDALALLAAREPRQWFHTAVPRPVEPSTGTDLVPDDAPLDSVAAVQRAIVAGMKRGGRFSSSHKEGGTHITWQYDRFVRSDYGDDPATASFTDEAAFLAMLWNFARWDATRYAPDGAFSDLDTWILTLRRMYRP